MTVVVRDYTTGTFDVPTHTMTIPVPALALSTDVLIVFLIAQSIWSGTATGFSQAQACPLYFENLNFDQAPALSDCWWADSANSVTFPGWTGGPTGSGRQCYQYAASRQGQGFNFPIASWVGMARVRPAVPPASYDFKILGVPPTDATHFYTGIMLAVSPYLTFGPVGTTLLPRANATSFDDLWNFNTGTHMRYTNVGTLMTQPGSSAPAMNSADLWLEILLYQGPPPAMEGFTYESGALFVPGDMTDVLNVQNTSTGTPVWVGWGYNYEGNLGLGVSTPSIISTPTSQALGFATVAQGGAPGTGLGLTSGGQVYAWGSNGYSGLGVGSNDFNPHPTPSLVTSLSGIDRIWGFGAPNSALFARVAATHNLYAWGQNLAGNLGLGAYSNQQTTPALSHALVDRVAGTQHSLLLTDAGVVRGCGPNVAGELPNVPLSTSTPSWIDLSTSHGRTVIDIAASQWQSYLLMSDGSVWGSGDSSLGAMGTLGGVTDWIEIVSSGAVAIAVHFYTLFYTLADGSVWALGSNQFGALGCGIDHATLTHTATPVQVLLPVPAVTVLSSHNMQQGGLAALGTDGTVYTWGDGYFGTYGDGTIDRERSTPTAVPGLVASALAGNSEALYAYTTGSVVTRAQIAYGYFDTTAGVPLVHDVTLSPVLPVRASQASPHLGYYSFGVATGIRFASSALNPLPARGRSFAQVIG